MTTEERLFSAEKRLFSAEERLFSAEERLFFSQWPQLIGLYEALLARLTAAHPDTVRKVSKTQISFYNRHLFAMVSLPVKRKKDWPKEFLLVTFGLEHPLDAPRIAARTEPYPNRWTHHVLLESPEQIDGELLRWLDEAYGFAREK